MAGSERESPVSRSLILGKASSRLHGSPVGPRACIDTSALGEDLNRIRCYSVTETVVVAFHSVDFEVVEFDDVDVSVLSLYVPHPDQVALNLG